MTKQQAELYKFIKDFLAANGYSPSWAEMRAATGRGSSGLRSSVRALAKMRKIRWHKGHWRGIEVRHGETDEN